MSLVPAMDEAQADGLFPMLESQLEVLRAQMRSADAAEAARVPQAGD